MRTLSLALGLCGLLVPGRATTLEKLSLDEIIRQSTAVVRAKVVNAHGGSRGQDIYTYYSLQVMEAWKTGLQPIEVAVPGGVSGNLRQVVTGAPVLRPGDEYVVFLWTSRSGLTQVIGLSQGLFRVVPDGSPDPMVTRPAAGELMLDKSGNVVSDQALSMHLSALRAQIQKGIGK